VPCGICVALSSKNKESKVFSIMIKRVIKEYGILTFGAVLAATAIYLFMLPCNLAIGSSAALAMVLSNIIPLPVSVMSLIINVFLLICGFVLIGPEFGAKTVYTSIVMPVSLSVWELIYPNNPSLTQDPLVDMICSTMHFSTKRSGLIYVFFMTLFLFLNTYLLLNHCFLSVYHIDALGGVLYTTAGNVIDFCLSIIAFGFHYARSIVFSCHPDTYTGLGSVWLEGSTIAILYLHIYTEGLQGTSGAHGMPYTVGGNGIGSREVLDSSLVIDAAESKGLV
jgi:hypothetical protein